MNLELLQRVVEQMEAEPERWEQDSYFDDRPANRCGTTLCFAGWTAVLAGYVDDRTGCYTARGIAWAEQVCFVDSIIDPVDVCWDDLAVELLGIDRHQADVLFAGDQFNGSDVSTLRPFIRHILGVELPPKTADDNHD